MDSRWADTTDEEEGGLEAPEVTEDSVPAEEVRSHDKNLLFRVFVIASPSMVLLLLFAALTAYSTGGTNHSSPWNEYG